MTSILMWIGAIVLAVLSIALTGSTELEAGRQNRQAHVGYFVASLYLMVLALLMAHYA